MKTILTLPFVDRFIVARKLLAFLRDMRVQVEGCHGHE